MKFDELKGIVFKIERLRIYIKKGCLFGFLFGEGIEFNESFDYIFNKILLCGVIIIGSELVFVILIFLFYGINCKIDGKNILGIFE